MSFSTTEIAKIKNGALGNYFGDPFQAIERKEIKEDLWGMCYHVGTALDNFEKQLGIDLVAVAKVLVPILNLERSFPGNQTSKVFKISAMKFAVAILVKDKIPGNFLTKYKSSDSGNVFDTLASKKLRVRKVVYKHLGKFPGLVPKKIIRAAEKDDISTIYMWTNTTYNSLNRFREWEREIFQTLSLPGETDFAIEIARAIELDLRSWGLITNQKKHAHMAFDRFRKWKNPKKFPNLKSLVGIIIQEVTYDQLKRKRLGRSQKPTTIIARLLKQVYSKIKRKFDQTI